MARQDSMATIDAALASASLATSQPATASPDVSIAPGVGVGSPLTDSLPSMTGDQKRAFDANRTAALDLKADQKEIAKGQENALKQQLATEQAEQDAFKASAQATTQAVKSIVRKTGVTLGNLPQPGSIMLPLVILLVFFLLLIPVNGHTRFVWIWMVLSGNAQIGSTSPGSGGSSPAPAPGDSVGAVGSSGGTAPTVTTPNFPAVTPYLLESMTANFPSGTYVEEVS